MFRKARFPGCPHADVRDCPLYLAAHVAYADGRGYSCDDGRLDEGGCAADRKWPYAKALARLRIADPRLVAEVEFHAAARQAADRRRSNMQRLGLH